MNINPSFFLIAVFTMTVNTVHAASLVDGQTLHFTAATTGGGTVEPTLGTGSYFGYIPGEPPSPEYGTRYVPMSSYNGIVLGSAQSAGGSHYGPIDGTESPNIDNPWEIYGNAGMHMSVSPISVLSPTTIDFSGWGIHTYGNFSSMALWPVNTATYAYDNVSGAFTLDYMVSWYSGGFGIDTYILHLEGTASPVPLPAAVWLFGSGLVGLLGWAQRGKTPG